MRHIYRQMLIVGLLLAMTLLIGAHAFAFTDAQMREFYRDCQLWQKMSLPMKKRVVALSHPHVTIAQETAACKLTLSRSVQSNLRLEHEYQHAVHSGRNGQGYSSGDDGESAPEPSSTPLPNYGPNVCPDGSRGNSCTLSPDGTYSGPNLCPSGHYGDRCDQVCSDGSYGCG